jgi:hypothetical protein
LWISLASRRTPLTDPGVFLFKSLSLLSGDGVFAFIDFRTFSGSRGKIPGPENADLMFETVTERSQAAAKSRQKLRFVRRENPRLD